jgi:peptidyl-prolyl cis-trans isomerase SurA
MIKKFFTTLLLTVSLLGAVAQNANDPVVFQINGKNIYKSQFMKEFLQSIGKDPNAAPTACTYEKRKALEDYVQLYVNFQTKLADAYAMGYDTLTTLNQELAGYRKELAAPYLIDSATLQQLLREAYDRNHYVLHAAHILVHCPESATPEDTLKAYTHAMEVYQEALKSDNFYEVAQKEMRYQRMNDRDPLVREKADQVNPLEGDLGCFTVFDMIYAFESAAYAMKPGEVSKPVRSRYGYHIIKLFDRYNYYGKAQFAHIWIPENTFKAEGKIKDAYRQLKEGADFGVVAKNYSGDQSTSDKGGVMPELAPNQLPYAYIEAVAKGLEVGDYTEPFHTRFGWHIIKLLKKETMPELESLVPYYRSRMTRGERSTKPQKMFVDQCKQRYGFVDYTQVVTSKKKAKKVTYAASLDAVRAIVSDSIFSAIFHYDPEQITDMRPLFKIGDQEYNSRQFARYIYKTKKVRALCDLDIFVAERYQEFIDAMVLDYADSRLELDNPEFAALVDEYRHGLMIFTYNDQKVWSKAIKDTVGFAEFYNNASLTHNYNDTNDAVYFWNERARTVAYTVSDSTILPRSKALKVVNKALKKGWSSSVLVNELRRKAKCDSIVTANLTLLEKGNQSTLTGNEWHPGVFAHVADSGYQILVVEKIMPPALKTREEARGYYLNDYQNYLEEQNNIALRKKYNVIIHQNVIDEIVY